MNNISGLSDLIRFVEKVKDKAPDNVFFKELDEDKTKVAKFYNLVAAGAFADDKEAAKALYNESKSHPAYQKLKTTIRDRLVDNLFLLNLEKIESDIREQFFFSCSRDLFFANILYAQKKYAPAISSYLTVLDLSKEFEFTEINIEICRVLRLHYSLWEPNSSEFEKFNALFLHYNSIRLAERKVEGIYVKMTAWFVNHKSINKSLIKEVIEWEKEALTYLENNSSFKLHLIVRLISIGLNRLSEQKEKVIQVCDEAIAYFENLTYSANQPLNIFFLEKAVNFFNLGNFSETLLAVKEARKYAQEASFNWFKLEELTALCYFQLEDFKKASQIAIEVMQSDSFNDQPANIQEFWVIIKGYLFFLDAVAAKTQGKQDAIKIQKSIEALVAFPKDKMGMNIPIIILQILFDLLFQRKDKLIDGFDRINQYRKRYLITEENHRSNLIFKLLLLLPKKGFQKEAINLAASNILEELQEWPRDKTNQSYMVEIIPYELLWQIAKTLAD